MPGAVDAPTNPTATGLQNAAGVEHDLEHANANDGLLAVERIVVGPVFVNVKSDVYGAKGDGSTTDTSAINSALTAGASNVVRLPPGTYVIDDVLTPSNNCIIRGSGMGVTTLKVKNSASMASGAVIQKTDATNLVIEDLTIDLNKANTTNGASDTAQLGIYLYANTAVTNCHIRRVEVKNGWQHGIRVDSSNVANTCQVNVSDCVVQSNNFHGMFLRKCSDLKVRGCTANTNGSATTPGAGIVFDQPTTAEVVSCRAVSNYTHGISTSTTTSQFFTVANNVCNNNGTGGVLGWGIVASVISKWLAITGNICDSNYSGGITVDVKDGTSTIQTTVGTVVANVCSNSTATHGINVNYGSYLSITGNTCYGNTSGRGIAVQDSLYCTVSGNTLINNFGGIYLVKSGSAGSNPGGHVIGPNTFSGNSNSNFATDSGMVAHSRLDGEKLVVPNGTAPTIAAGGGLGTSPPTSTLTGTDTRGTVSLGTGTGPFAGFLCTVTFNKAFAAAPIVVLTPTGSSSASAILEPYVTSVGTTSFVIACAQGPTASQSAGTYQFNYVVIG